eukprot:scaffold49391_cov22-Tisochrysis_lutea.AAC.1
MKWHALLWPTLFTPKPPPCQLQTTREMLRPHVALLPRNILVCGQTTCMPAVHAPAALRTGHIAAYVPLPALASARS